MIVSTKLHIPHLRSELIVERPAIIKILNEGLKNKLTAVTAPGGYSKTTALSHWVQQNGIPCAWVSLDPLDNDLTQFWTYVIAAIGSKRSNFAEVMSPHLSTLKSGAFEPFITALIHELSGFSDELALIWDDFHSINLSSIHASVARLLELLPAQIHLYISSRAEVPFPTARLQSTGQLVAITIQDLRFQLDEGIRYFRDCMGFSLAEQDISMLVRRTEGWISGLHLAAISLNKRDDYTGFIHAFCGEDRNISDYLFQEVLSRQSEEMQVFLLETSILNRMNDSLCEAVTGRPNSQELLELLEQQNLFIVPLDERRQWYRYHHLFSDFLRKHLRQKHSARWKQLYIHAASWLGRHELYEEAVEHFLMGEHHLEAASMIEKHLLGVQLKSGLLQRWFTLLPESCLTGKPELQFLYVKVLADSDMELAGSKLRMMEDNLSDAEWKPFVGTYFYLSAMISFYRRDFKRADEYLEKFERLMPEGSYIQMSEANSYTINYDSLLVFFNDLHEAERFFYKWIKVWENKKNYPFVGFFYNAYSELLYEWNRLEEAEVYAERALREKCMQPYGLILKSAAISNVRIYLAKGDSAKAFELLEQVALKIESPDKSIFIKKLDVEKANLSLANGSFDDVTAWLESCGFRHTDTVPLNSFREYLYLARALMEFGQVNEALLLLEHLYLIVKAEDRLRDKLKVSILQSIALDRKGNRASALLKLETALQLAERGEYIRSFVDEGTQMAELLSQYLHQRQNRVIRQSKNVSLLYVKKLLHLMQPHLSESLVFASLLTGQELKILRMIEMGLSNKEIAEQIQVTAETVKSHVKNIYRKLEVNRRLQALQRGRELNLL